MKELSLVKKRKEVDKQNCLHTTFSQGHYHQSYDAIAQLKNTKKQKDTIVKKIQLISLLFFSIMIIIGTIKLVKILKTIVDLFF